MITSNYHGVDRVEIKQTPLEMSPPRKVIDIKFKTDDGEEVTITLFPVYDKDHIEVDYAT